MNRIINDIRDWFPVMLFLAGVYGFIFCMNCVGQLMLSIASKL